MATRRPGHVNVAPTYLVALAGLGLLLYAWVLLWFWAAGILVIAFFTVMIGGFTGLGVLVANDAQRRSSKALVWGLLVLFTGPVGVIFYAWTRPPMPTPPT